jgi:hypothetical protein
MDFETVSRTQSMLSKNMEGAFQSQVQFSKAGKLAVFSLAKQKNWMLYRSRSA